MKDNDILKALYKTLKATQKRLSRVENASREPLAVIGMACRFPGGADTIARFRDLLQTGGDGVCDVPPERWDKARYYDADPEAPGKTTTNMAGFLREPIDGFDCGFFHLSPREVERMDPQQRLLLEVCWEAFENAGIDPATLKGSRTGVFCGIANSDYAAAHMRSGDPGKIDAFAVTGTALSTAVGRISYLFGFEGPNLSLDTACSSSLVAVHLAASSLRGGESDLAVAGGINLILSPEGHIGFSKLKAISPDGRCKSFDDGADGYGRGEGCGVVLLKRLSDAQKAGDRVLAVIRATAVNQDGRTNGLTAPSSRSQEKLLQTALAEAGMRPEDIGYIEAHGTGTPLGDPIEMNAVGSVYSAGRSMEAPLHVGSVKANIGHLEAAAGIASLIKTVLMLEGGLIFPQIHFRQPSRYIPWDRLPVSIPEKLMSWPAGATPRSAGVSSFGFSGTNAHAILSEYKRPAEEDAAPSADRPHHILPLSARTPEALAALAERYGNYLSDADEKIADICHTAAVGRRHFPHRLALTGRTREELAQKLASQPDDLSTLGTARADGASNGGAPVVFLFTGQGAQYHRMGWDLYRTQPIFKAALDRCDELLRPHMDRRLISLLYEDDAAGLNQTCYSQPVIFSVAYALARLLAAWGITPALMVGHSLGEYVAATLAGIFRPEDALALVAARGKLVQSLPKNGRMAVLTAGEAQVRKALAPFEGKVSIAALNAPANTVISGEKGAVRQLCEDLRKSRVTSNMLNISHAFHSCLLDPIVDAFREVAAGITYLPPRLPLMANVTGRRGGAEMASADYWTTHLREPVRFYDSMLAVAEENYSLFLEVGGTSTLTRLGRQCLAGREAVWLTTLGSTESGSNLRPGRPAGHSDWEPLTDSLAGLYRAGVDIDWQAFDRPYARRRVQLPNYPFQRKRYWMELTPHRKPNETSAPPAVEASPAAADPSDRRARIAAEVHRLMHRSSELEILPEDYDTNLFELGFASMMIARLKDMIQRTFNLTVQMSWFYDRLDTVNKVVDYILQTTPDEPAAAPADPARETPRPAASPSGEADGLIRRQIDLMDRQLEVMAEQLRMLGGAPAGAEKALTARRNDLSAALSDAEAPAPSPESRPKAAPPPDYVAYRGVTTREKLELSRRQQEHLKQLIERYTGRTPASKAVTQKYRPIFANTRNISGFRPEWKEMIYQIIVDKAAGSRFSDIDGKSYLDISMGFGVYLLGHNPPVVQAALQQELQKGTPIGPMSYLAGEVAALIHELTGAQRSAFFNTGTESVMAAMRIARTVTGRRKIVIFSGAYHGHFDGVMGVKDVDGPLGRAVPMCPGTLPEMVNDLYVLDYDSKESLRFIEAHGRELAAVLVEPVQSRRPELQPKAFLKQLREITAATGAALIFDEMIVGFRTHPGGAQAWFGVDADIVTYGKVVGGGVPIGVVAGRARYLDAVDGGMWRYGDGSFPERENTFIAGTFNHHPLAMAGARAVLSHLKTEGPALQETLNRRTDDLARRINTFFEDEALPLRLTHFGSLFRLPLKGDQELLYYHLLSRGIYIWEGRNCFLSTAHSDQDIDYLVGAVKESIAEMRAGGLFKDKKIAPVAAAAATTDAFPLSAAQNRMFVLSQAGGEAGYHIPVALFIDGPLDGDRLEEIFGNVIQEHEILRTGFEVLEDGVVQRVHSRAEFALERRDIMESQADETIRELIRSFDPARPPLMRGCLARISDRRHLLVVDAHHIVFDGISANLLMETVIRRYSGERTVLPTAQYRDYAALEQAYLKSGDYTADAAFWRERFAAPVPLLDLPADHARPPVKSYRGDRIVQRLEGEPLSALRGVARRTGTSLHMSLLAAYFLLLHKLSGNEDVVVGATYDGREGERFADCLGMFVQTLPIRCRLDRSRTLWALLDEVKKTVLTAHDHQRYPFEHLVSRLDMVRDPGRNPLFDTMFVYETQAGDSLEAGGLTFAEKICAPGTAIFDLVLDIADTGQALKLSLEYSTDLFSPATAERFLGNYLTLLNQMADRLETPLAGLEILSADEKHRLLTDFNATAADYPREKTLVDLFQEQAAQRPRAVAVKTESGALTYGELNLRANRLAHHLRDVRGIGPDDRVALLLDRGEGLIVGIFGILKAGGAYVPIDPSYPKERIDFMLQDSGCKVVVTEAGLAHLAQGVAAVDLAAACRAADGNDENPPRTHGPADLAYVIYTSGSTGRPKGVLIEHRQVVRLMTNDKFQFDFSADDVWTLFHSCCFDFSVWEMYGALLYGGTLVIVSKEIARDTEKFLALLKEQRVTVLNQTPRAFYNLAALESASPSVDLSLRYVIFGGEALKPALLKAFSARYPRVRLINMYGITETTVHVTYKEIGPKEMESNQSNVGRPIPTLSVHIMDRDLNLTPVGVPGELVVGGDGVARGYLNREELTREKFVENPHIPGERLYRSGDLARRLPDGEIEYLGRIDEQVKIRGFRIEPGEIESALVTHPAITQAVVSASEDAVGDRFLKAYLTAEGDLRIEALRAHLEKSLPDYMIPARFVRVARLPLTANGKIDAGALAGLETEESFAAAAAVAPQNEKESLLVEIWRAVLGRERVGVLDNYFALGGDSIKAIQILSRLKQHELKLEVRHIFETPTIRALARRLESGGRTASQEAVVGLTPLTAIQRWFFTENTTYDHFAQAVLLRASAPVDEGALHQALNALQVHHDALRMRYRIDGESVVQETIGPEYPLDLEIVDLREEIEPTAALEHTCARTASLLKIETGPMLKTVLFKTKDEDRLLLVIHHLAVDGVSWRILLEDFFMAYEQAVAGKPPALPPKSDAFRDWAGAVERYGESSRLRDELPFWRGLEEMEILAVPVDHESTSNLHGDNTVLEATLSREQTDTLLTTANSAYHTETVDLLLTALGRALKRRCGTGRGVIDLEGHGREGLFADLDVHRTVGWFTTIYPALIDLPESDDPAMQIKQVKEGLRRIPQKGVGYGILKYLAPWAVGDQLPAGRRRLLFNYLGGFDLDGSNGFRLDRTAAANTVGGGIRRESEIVVEGAVIDRRLTLRLHFNPHIHTPKTAEGLLEAYREELLFIIDHCRGQEGGELTPCDLSYPHLSLPELSAVLKDCGIARDNLKDIYPLSPLQEGMLFHAMLESESDAYFMQISFGIDGALDPALFENCWHYLVRRHDILRTHFVRKGADRPLQVVMRDGKMDFEWEDISHLSEEARQTRLAEFRTKDREEGVDPLGKVPMRVRLFKTADHRFAVVWSFHHLLIDGWCAGILMSEFFEAYGAKLSGGALDDGEAPPYGDYIRWIGNPDRRAGIDYWRSYLDGYHRPAVLPKGEAPDNAEGFRPETLRLTVDAEAFGGLKRFAADHQVTVNTIVQAAWGVVLGRCSGSDDVVFGATVSGRPSQVARVESMVGLFINTVPVRVRIDSDEKLSDLARRVQADALKSEAHHYGSLADIQANSALKQELIDHVLVFENYPLADELIGLERKYGVGFSISGVNVFEQTHFDLSIVVEPGERLEVEFRYNGAVFTEALMEKIKTAFYGVLEAAAVGKDRRLADLALAMMSVDEKNEREAYLQSAQEISEDF